MYRYVEKLNPHRVSQMGPGDAAWLINQLRQSHATVSLSLPECFFQNQKMFFFIMQGTFLSLLLHFMLPTSGLMLCWKAWNFSIYVRTPRKKANWQKQKQHKRACRKRSITCAELGYSTLEAQCNQHQKHGVLSTESWVYLATKAWSTCTQQRKHGVLNTGSTVYSAPEARCTQHRKPCVLSNKSMVHSVMEAQCT